jgi:hypothetical protein
VPNAAFASGFLNGFIDTQTKERDRRDQNARDAINFMVSTGRIRNYDDLKPMLEQLFPGLGGKAGKGGGGKGGQQDPNAQLKQYIDPIFTLMHQNNQQQGGGGQPQAQPWNGGGGQGAPQQPGDPQRTQGGGQSSMFLSDEELQQRQASGEQQKADIQFGTKAKELGLEHGYRTQENQQTEAAALERVKEQNKGKTGSDLHQLYMAKQQAFEVNNGRPPNDEENAKLMIEARDQWQSAGRKVTSEEAFTKSWMADAAKDGALTPTQEKLERLKARKAWQINSQSETPGEKLGRAEALAKFREQLTAVSPADLQQLSQAVKIGDKTTPYLDVTGFTGKERAQAMKGAIGQGIIPVNAKQAEGLAAAQSASANLDDLLAQIKSKLPADAASRPLTSIENKLSAYFQTDTELAAATAWDTTIIPMLRAISTAGLGRITNRELDLAESSRPKITDTVATAARKVEIVRRILQNAVNPVVTRGGSQPSAGGTTPPPKTPPVQADPLGIFR